MVLTLLIGAAPYYLDGSAALWLEETIRRRYSDDTGRPLDIDELDEPGITCLQLADLIARGLRSGNESPDPIELSDTQIEAFRALLGELPADPDDLTQLEALADACRRYSRQVI